MSVVAEAKKNWLDQVKADAEKLTRERLAVDLPKLDKVAAQLQAQSVPKAQEPEVEEPAEAAPAQEEPKESKKGK